MFTENQNTAADGTSPSSLIQDDNPSIEPDLTTSTEDEDIEAGVDDLDDTEDSAGATEMSPAVNTCPCNCLCCQNYEIPHQSTAAELEKSKSQSGRQTRSIQTSWYVKYPWISVCTTSYNIFCHVCCNAKKQNLIHFSSHYNPTFVEGGFSNWKKALQRFANHEKSEMHREAIMKLAAKSSRIDVSGQLSKSHATETRNNRAMFLKLLECIRYLARQGLAFRGRHEDSIAFEGNLYQLLLLQAKDSIQLASWIKKRDYISPAIVNEIINISGNTILRQLLQEIQAADWFSLIADEATDVSHNEQMCIAVRWVDSSYTIHEAALGLVQLPDTKALTLFGIIKDVLLRCSLPITDCVGQAYDGASNMSGV